MSQTTLKIDTTVGSIGFQELLTTAFIDFTEKDSKYALKEKKKQH